MELLEINLVLVPVFLVVLLDIRVHFSNRVDLVLFLELLAANDLALLSRLILLATRNLQLPLILLDVNLAVDLVYVL